MLALGLQKLAKDFRDFRGFACQSSSANFKGTPQTFETHSDVVFTIFAVLFDWKPVVSTFVESISFCKKSQVVLSPIFPWFNPLSAA